MKVLCPHCHTDDETYYTGDTKMSESGELYEVKIYACPKCDETFDEDEIDDRKIAPRKV